MNARRSSAACLAAALAYLAACAATGGEEKPNDTPDPGDGGTLNFDATTKPDAEAGPPPIPTCSSAGWCKTALPDSDLWFKDVWPLGQRAFALASGDSLGNKVLEWDGARWTYIDDNGQNEGRANPYNVWAPNDDEVYFTIYTYDAIFGDGSFGSVVFRGIRPTPPSTEWSWTRQRFDCDYFDTFPQIWGTSADDVYFSGCRKIYRRSSAAADSGASQWAQVYADEDPAHPMDLFGATGTGPDDIWFVGGRGGFEGTCSVVLHKTASGVHRVVDGVPGSDGTCVARPGFLLLPGIMRTAFHAVSKGRLVGARTSYESDNDVVRLVLNADGTYAVSLASPAATMDVNLTSVWGTSDDDLWFIASRSQSGGVVRGKNIWSGSGTYEYSTLVINGSPNTRALEKVRGTSIQNLWAVGNERAYHKATP